MFSLLFNLIPIQIRYLDYTDVMVDVGLAIVVGMGPHVHNIVGFATLIKVGGT